MFVCFFFSLYNSLSLSLFQSLKITRSHFQLFVCFIHMKNIVVFRYSSRYSLYLHTDKTKKTNPKQSPRRTRSSFIRVVRSGPLRSQSRRHAPAGVASAAPAARSVRRLRRRQLRIIRIAVVRRDLLAIRFPFAAARRRRVGVAVAVAVVRGALLALLDGRPLWRGGGARRRRCVALLLLLLLVLRRCYGGVLLLLGELSELRLMIGLSVVLMLVMVVVVVIVVRAVLLVRAAAAAVVMRVMMVGRLRLLRMAAGVHLETERNADIWLGQREVRLSVQMRVLPRWDYGHRPLGPSTVCSAPICCRPPSLADRNRCPTPPCRSSASAA